MSPRIITKAIYLPLYALRINQKYKVNSPVDS